MVIKIVYWTKLDILEWPKSKDSLWPKSVSAVNSIHLRQLLI